MRLLFGRLAQGDDAVALLVHVPGDPTDRSTLPGCIATFEDHDHGDSLGFKVPLQLEELDLVVLEWCILVDAFLKPIALVLEVSHTRGQLLDLSCLLVLASFDHACPAFLDGSTS